MNTSGSFLSAACVRSHSTIFFINGSLKIQAFSGQARMQAQHSMHFFLSVSIASLREIAETGQTEIHVSHWVQRSFSVTGEVGGCFTSSLNGRFPGKSGAPISSSFRALFRRSPISLPNSWAILMSAESGRPAAIGEPSLENECSPINAPPATGVKPALAARSDSSQRASSISLLP